METKNMNAKEGMRALSLLLVVALAGAMFVPVVSAVDTANQAKSAIIEDPDGMELVKYSNVPSNSLLGTKSVTYEWRAYTNIWHIYDEIYSEQYSKSREQGTGG